MDVFEAIQKRKSVRAYQAKPVPRKVIKKILEAGRIAPSAVNFQPWHFIVVTDAEKRKVLSRGPYAKFLTQAPVVIVGCGDTKASPDWFTVDVSIALENMVLAATAEGLGTCWIGGFQEDEVKALLEIPDHFTVVALLAVGYEREKKDGGRKLQHRHKRKRLAEIVSGEKYGEGYVSRS
jgi:nitroreductase